MPRVTTLKRRQDLQKGKQRRKYTIYLIISIIIVLIDIWVVMFYKPLSLSSSSSSSSSQQQALGSKQNSLSDFLRESKQRQTKKSVKHGAVNPNSGLAPTGPCEEDALTQYLGEIQNAKGKPSLKEKVGLAKLRFALEHPYLEFPSEITNCQVGRGGKRAYNFFQNLVIPNSYLRDIINLETTVPDALVKILMNKKDDSTTKNARATLVSANAYLQYTGSLESELLADERLSTTIHVVNGEQESCEQFQKDVDSKVIAHNAQDTFHVHCMDPSSKENHPLLTHIPQNNLASSADVLTMLKVTTKGHEAMTLAGFASWLANTNNSRPRFVVVMYNHGWMRKVNVGQGMEILEILSYHGYICTTLAYEHVLDTTTNQYGQVQVPYLKDSSPSTKTFANNFEDLTESITNHGRWKDLKGIDLPSAAQKKSGLTHLMCVA